MPTFISAPSVIVVQNFSSGHGTVVPKNFSAESEISLTRFSSEATTVSKQFQIPGGCLTWTVRKNNQDSVHAVRLHGALYGSVPPFHPWDDTKVNDDADNFIEASDGVVSPFYSSPSAHVTSDLSIKISAVSQGLSVFSLAGSNFNEDVHNINSRHSLISAKMASLPEGDAASGYLLDSGNLYYEAGIPEDT